MHMCVRVLELVGVGGLRWKALNADVCGLSQTEGSVRVGGSVAGFNVGSLLARRRRRRGGRGGRCGAGGRLESSCQCGCLTLKSVKIRRSSAEGGETRRNINGKLVECGLPPAGYVGARRE